MTEFRVVTAGELVPIFETLNALAWPVPFDDFPAIFEHLGWEKQRRKGGITNLPVSLKLVSVGDLRGEITEIAFRISDTLPIDQEGTQQVVNDAFPGAVRTVAAALGSEPTGEPWVDSGVLWDLAGGRQIRVLRGERTIELLYWSSRMADIERHERSHGVDPEHNLDDRE